MGRLIVSFPSGPEWPIEPPLSDAVGERVYRAVPGRSRRALVFANGLANAIRMSADPVPASLTSLLEIIEGDDDTLMLEVEWRR